MALLAVCGVLYSRTFGIGFLNLDDPDYIQNNAFIANLTSAKLWHIFSRPYFANYAPGHLLSYALDVAVAGGKSAWAMHFSNVAWYGFSVSMVYVLGLGIYRRRQESAGEGFAPAELRDARNPTTSRLGSSAQDGRKRTSLAPNAAVTNAGSTQVLIENQGKAGASYTAVAMAFAAALLFAAHPAHVEVVAWLSSRKDLVATAFAALSMACYLRSGHSGSSARGWYWGSILSFLLASSGKQSVLLLPAVMLAWDVLVDKRRGWRMVAEKIPYGLIALFFGWMTWGAQPSTRQSPDPFVLAMTQWSNLWLLTGFGQYVLYRPAPDPSAVGLLARLAIIGAAVSVWAVPVVLVRWRRPIEAVLCLWVLIQMLPPMVLSFLTPITDRYLFLPSVGICLMLAGLKPGDVVNRRKWMGTLGLLAFGLVIAVWSWKAWSYVGEWCDPRSVWYCAAEKSPSPQAYEYSGGIYQDAGDRVRDFIQSGQLPSKTNDLALARAVLADPTQFEQLSAEWSGARQERTNSLTYRDRLWSLAWDQFQQAAARRGTLDTPALFMRRGMILLNRGRHPEAIQEFKTGLALAQTHTYERVRQEMGTNLKRAIGVAYWGMGDYSNAKDWLLQAQATQRQSGQVWAPTLDTEVERINGLARQRQ